MKRIITCSDGTWNLPGDTEDGHIVRTNVQKIFEAICNEDGSGVHQLKYYDEGIGVQGNKWKRRFDGMTGRGLDQNIFDIYKFICWNYSQGDELYLFGFSRGAYTARSLAGLIRCSGLVKNNDLKLIQKAYDIYRDRSDPRTAPDGQSAMEFKKEHCQPEFRIKFIGVWDTVGSLGIPVNVLGVNNKYKFHDTKLSSAIEYAYQALAIDEKRKNFMPAIWEQSETARNNMVHQVLEQVWFAGVHSNIGGGYPDEGLSDISLDWMVEKAKSAGLAFEESYLEKNIKPDHKGELYNSFVAPFSWLGKYLRPVDLVSGANQSIHPSVVQRVRDVKSYNPPNLSNQQKL